MHRERGGEPGHPGAVADHAGVVAGVAVGEVLNAQDGGLLAQPHGADAHRVGHLLTQVVPRYVQRRVAPQHVTGELGVGAAKKVLLELKRSDLWRLCNCSIKTFS